MQNGGQLYIITYFRTITKPEHQKLKIFSIASNDDLASGPSLKKITGTEEKEYME